MSEANWQSVWQQAQSSPYSHIVVTLLKLNGLYAKQIKRLPDATIDTNKDWLTTNDGMTYPLVSYAAEALRKLPNLDRDKLEEAVDKLEHLEADAHRRLAGALWVSNEENQHIREITGFTEAPLLPLENTFPFSIKEHLQAGETSEVAVQSQAVLQAAADWLYTQSLQAEASLCQRVTRLLRKGSLVFLIASTGVNGLNFIHNILMGRLLTPSEYSQLTFIITLQLLIGLLPTALQTVVARFSARYLVQNETALVHNLHNATGRFGWLSGFAFTALVLITSPVLVDLFQLRGIALILPVLLAVPLFVRTGIDRGYLQGVGSYFWLSGSYIGEAVVRLVMGVLLGYALLEVGRSLDGAIWGLALSMIITWMIGYWAMRQRKMPCTQVRSNNEQRSEWVQLTGLTLIALIGQALITNSDFILVKRFFSSEDAGLYAAVTVLGRIVYFGALPLTILLVPLIARRQALAQPTRPILLLLVVGGIALCMLLIGLAAVFSGDVLRLLYGESYVPAANLLAPYALAASLYTLTNLVVTYQIALGSGAEVWIPVVAGTAQIIAVTLFHNSLTQVITIQIVLMGLLFGTVMLRTLNTTEESA